MFGPTDNDGYSLSKKDAPWKAKKCVANFWTCRNCYCTPRNEFHKWKIKSGPMMKSKTIKCSTAPSYFFTWQIMGKRYFGFEDKPLAFILVAIARTTRTSLLLLLPQKLSRIQPPVLKLILKDPTQKTWNLPAPLPLCRHFSIDEELRHPRQEAWHSRQQAIKSKWRNSFLF